MRHTVMCALDGGKAVGELLDAEGLLHKLGFKHLALVGVNHAALFLGAGRLLQLPVDGMWSRTTNSMLHVRLQQGLLVLLAEPDVFFLKLFGFGERFLKACLKLVVLLLEFGIAAAQVVQSVLLCSCCVIYRR